MLMLYRFRMLTLALKWNQSQSYQSQSCCQSHLDLPDYPEGAAKGKGAEIKLIQAALQTYLISALISELTHAPQKVWAHCHADRGAVEKTE
jgi:hypothetical protein